MLIIPVPILIMQTFEVLHENHAVRMTLPKANTVVKVQIGCVVQDM